MIGHSMGARVLSTFFDKFNEISIDSEGRAVMNITCVNDVPNNVASSDVEKGKPSSASESKLTGDLSHLPKFGAMLFVNGEADLPVFQSAYRKCMHELAESITVIVDTTDFALGWAQKFNWLQQWKNNEKFAICLGCIHAPIYDNEDNDSNGNLLDVDVINASMIAGSNVDKNRHCYFHLSRQTLEDIREIVVSRKRAKDRKGRLVRSEGNLYDFLVCPSYISKIG